MSDRKFFDDHVIIIPVGFPTKRQETAVPQPLTATIHRPIRVIAEEIRRTWPNIYFGAVPYLRAMADLDKVTDRYGPGQESARDIIGYFLGNAKTWKGEDARRIKAELKALVGRK